MINLQILLLTMLTPIANPSPNAQSGEFPKVEGGNFVTVEGVRLHYRKGGQGPYLLLLHGFTLSSEQWSEYFDDFGRHYTIIALDFPGHGQSERTGRPFNFSDWTQLTIRAIDKLGIKQARAIGHSYGAITLMSIARQQADLIEAMVLISGAHRLHPAMQAILLEDSFDKADEDLQTYYRNIHNDDMEQITGIFTDIRTFSGNASVLKRKQLEKINLPVFLIFGDRDPYYPLEIIDEIHRSLSNSQLWVIPQQGHAPVWQIMGADEFTGRIFSKRVIKFLQTYER
jgi:pimeloyl-ACP methyl ester carboxylesterase